VTKHFTGDLAEFVADLEFADLPSGVIEAAKLHILDTIACAVRGSDTEESKIATDFVKELGGNAESTLIMQKFKTNSANAAFANGVMAHAIEMDDTHSQSITHPGAVTIPAALALGEKMAIDGRTIITAIVSGYEIMTRIGMALGTSHYRYWHVTSTAGIFGSTATASKILGLTSDEVVHAFGTAGTQSSGLWEFNFEGAMSRVLHVGKSAQEGIESALLAKKGFTGASTILEGKKGLFNATSKDYSLKRLTQDLGKTYEISRTAFKAYASCRHTHSPIYAILNLKEKHGLDIEDAKKIIVKTYSIAADVAGEKNPTTSYKAKFSLPYCIAIALKEGAVGPEQFASEKICNKDTKRLLGKIEVVVDPEIDKLFPSKWASVVSIETVDNRIFEEAIDYPKGDPENPLSTLEIERKFESLVHYTGNVSVKEVVDKILNLDKIDDIKELMFLLSG